MWTKNLATWDRAARAIGGGIMAACTALAPLPLGARLAIFGAMAGYLWFSALAGTCLGYRVMGMATCPVPPATTPAADQGRS